MASGANAGAPGQVNVRSVGVVAASCHDALLLQLVVDCVRDGSPQARQRIEALGYAVGFRLVERVTARRPLFVDTLDVVKFLCRDLWYAVFSKHVDHLKASYRGSYVLQDNQCRWLAKVRPNGKDAGDFAAVYALFPCGVIQGALANLGLYASVSADVSARPMAKFSVKIKQ